MRAVVFVDPSSRVAGCAVMRPGELIDGSLLRAKASDPPIRRIAALCEDLRELCHIHKPETVVIEITSGHVANWLKGKLDRRGKQAQGMGVYGMGVGAMWREACHCVPPQDVHAVIENDWTGGKSKASRQQRVAAQFPAYRQNMKCDPGGDVSDAIGLGLWWFARVKERMMVT